MHPHRDLPLLSLFEHARNQPDTAAVSFLLDGEENVQTWTYVQLLCRARDISVALAKYKGKHALILHPPGLEFIACLYACWMAGVVAVPSPLPKFSRHNRAATRFSALVEDAQVSVALIAADNLQRTLVFCRGNAGLEKLQWLATDTLPVSRNEAPASPVSTPGLDDLALLQYTSGSTGTPRGVMLSHGNIAANQAAIRSKFGHTPASSVCSWLPPHHDMGLIGGILQPLTLGIPVVLMDPSHFMQRPVRWLQAISRYRITSSGGPDFAYQLCTHAISDDECAGLDLSSWDLAFTGAEPIRATTLEQFTRRFAALGFRQESFYPCYGLAEATLLATGGEKTAAPRLKQLDGKTHVACGTIIEHHKLRIVDAEGNPCPDGKTGEILLAGPSIARGYWNHPANTAVNFQKSGFLRTGDLGCLHDDELFVMGRLKDLIILGGRNFHPNDIEETTSTAHPALGASAAFSLTQDNVERLIVAVEIRREERHTLHREKALQAVREAIAREYGLHATNILLLAPGALPRTTSGKIRRSACQDAYQANTWKVLATSAEQAIAVDANASPTETLHNALSATPDERPKLLLRYLERRTAQILGVPASWMNTRLPLAEQGVDSLMRVELLLQLETDLGSSIGMATLTGEASLQSISNSILSNRHQNAGSSAETAALPINIGEHVPLTPLQHEFLRPGLQHPEKFHTISYLRIPAGTDIALLESAIRRLEYQFDALRIRFRQEIEGWQQYIVPPGSAVAFRRQDMGSTVASQFVRQLEETMHEGFDLTNGPLIQAIWLDNGKQKSGALVLGIHHLITDGTSIAVLLLALERAYRQPEATLQPRSGEISFSRWCRHLQGFAESPDILADLKYWQASCPPLEAEQASAIEAKWALIQRHLSAQQNQLLLRLFPSSRAQHDLFLTLLAQAWHQITGSPLLQVLLESHGRHDFPGMPAALTSATTVGWLTNRYPISIEIAPHETTGSLLPKVQAAVETVPNHGLSYGLLMHAHPDPAIRSAMARLARPCLSLVYRSRLDHAFRADAMFPVFMVNHANFSRQIDDLAPRIALEINRNDTAISWRVSYDRVHHEEARMQQLVQHISDLLAQIFAPD